MPFPIAYPNLYDYDLFPKVCVTNKATTITVRWLNGAQDFQENRAYLLRILSRRGGDPAYHPASSDCTEMVLTSTPERGFSFTHTFASEGEYTLRFEEVERNAQGKRVLIQAFQVYCIEADLARYIPLVGDLHMHSTYSDGDQAPEVVCANYRRHGYDFLAITDHRRYYPSLYARSFYQDIATELAIIPGEEVQLPQVGDEHLDAHVINFGGTYSINALVEGVASQEVGTDWTIRSLTPNCPPVMRKEEFAHVIREKAHSITVPDDVDLIPTAALHWIYDAIREAGGLGVYVHPNWVTNSVDHVPAALHDYLVQHRLFDAFEVLGGETYFEQNGLQTAIYHEDQARGHRYPIVGCTDSHGSDERNSKALIASTMVFAVANERAAIIDAIKAYRSVAIDTISAEFRLIGSTRLVRYAGFLLKNYIPLHDALCVEEGRLMKIAATGTSDEREEATALLAQIHGRVGRHRRKYLALES